MVALHQSLIGGVTFLNGGKLGRACLRLQDETAFGVVWR